MGAFFREPSAMQRTLLPLFYTISAFLLSGGMALANGRPPAVVDLRVNGEALVASTTFGIAARDSSTWRWTCETAAGYGGVFDPDIELSTRTGALFLSTIDGFRRTSDYCVFSASSLGDRFVSAIGVASNGDVFAATSDDQGSRIHRSTDDGVTFGQASMPFRNYDSWRSLVVAPSAPSRLYASGIRLVVNLPKKYLLYRSDDSGATFTELPTTSFAGLVSDSVILLAGVDANEPTVVYARVIAVNGTEGEAIYRSADAGLTWVQILNRPQPISFVVRRNGELWASTQDSPTVRSTDGGASFSEVMGAPRMSCLYEADDASLYGCTQNYGADDAAIVRSTDSSTWSKVLRFQDIKEPVPCAPGTIQKDTCELQEWCGLREQLGITSNAIDCAFNPPATEAGCCAAQQQELPWFPMILLFLSLWKLRRR